MQRVRAALEGDVHHSTRGPAVLHVIRIRLDLELLNRIHRRHQRDVVPVRQCVIGRAVQQEFVLHVEAAIHAPSGDRAIVERPLVNQVAIVIHARYRGREHEWIAPVQWQFGNALVADHLSPVRLGRIQ